MTLDTEDLRRRYEDWRKRIAQMHHDARPTVNEEVPFSPLRRPLAECRVALLTTSGAHLADQPPYDVDDPAGDPTPRLIPGDVDTASLHFTHTHYDTAPAERDPNVVFPLDRLRELAADGVVGEVAPVHIGMMGFNPDPAPILKTTATDVVDALTDCAADVVLLTPG